MFDHVRSLLTGRPQMWGAALICCLLVALPLSAAALLLVRPATMLVLTGDLRLAFDLVPGLTPVALSAVGLGILVLALVYNRIYAVLLWTSDERDDVSWGQAWRETRARWGRVLGLNLILLLVIVLTVLLLLLLLLVLRGTPGAASLTFLLGVTAIAALRTVGRIFVTLAARAAVLDDLPIKAAWRRAREIVRERRRDVVAAWAMLLATGAALWLGGRVVTPILQDTALDLPAYSGYALAREAAQLVFAVPLETFLLMVATGVWTAVYRDMGSQPRTEGRVSLMPRVMASLVGLVAIGNGVPAIADVRWSNAQDERKEALAAKELEPEDRLRGGDIVGQPKFPPNAYEMVVPRNVRTTYEVSASLDGETLEWSTRIEGHNRTDRAISSVPVNVYPAAFEGSVEDLPLAEDVLSTALRREVEPGTFEVQDVRNGGGSELRHDLDGTVLDIQLGRTVRPGDRFDLRIDLRAKLPRWPARFGVWRDIVQLGNWIPTIAPAVEGDFRVHQYLGVGEPFVAASADYRVDLEVDEGMTVVGSGRFARIDPATKRDTWTFSAPGLRDAAFVVGRGLRGLRGKYPGGEVTVWYTGDTILEAREVLEDASSALAYFSKSYGRLESDEIDIVLNESTIGGMEYPGLLFVSVGFPGLEGIPVVPSLVEHAGFDDELRRYITGHEIAHEWWFSEVGNDQAEEPWLDEAFAEVSTRSWLLERDGDELIWKISHLEREAKTKKGAIDATVDDFDSNSDYSDLVYLAGSEVLMELREVMGPERFDDLLRHWHERYRDKIASLDAFIELTGEVGGDEARKVLESYRS